VTTTEIALTVEHLRTTIQTPRGPICPVDDVSFTLRRGQTLGIVGESGSGKSQLVRSVLGLLVPAAKISPESKVLLGDVDLTKLDPAALRRHWGRDIALVPQDPVTSLNPVRKIGAQVTDPLRRHANMGKKEAVQRAAELLSLVGIADPKKRLNLYPHEMSGGMRQRVLIATAVAMSPKLLIADEPTTALDVTVQRQILDLIDTLREAEGMAVILVSHDLGVVSGRADNVGVMYGGRLVEMLSGSELATGSRHPYTRGLLSCRPDVRARAHIDLDTIPGEPPDLADRQAGCPFEPRCPHRLDICRTVDPPMVPIDGSQHRLACHNPVAETERLFQPSVV
jgi:peptide/nickel transport system ATP-binding protein